MRARSRRWVTHGVARSLTMLAVLLLPAGCESDHDPTDPGPAVYTYYGVDNTGQGDYAKGTVQGKIWTYQSETTIEGKTIKSRFVIDAVSDVLNKFKWEMSQDGATWSTVMEGQSSK